MKLPLVLALLFAAQSLHADWVLVEKTSTDGKGMTVKIKDNLIRNDMGEKMTVILNADEGVAQMYLHANKTLMRMDLNALKNASALAGKFLGGDSGPAPKPKATGEHVKVGDWDAEIYTWESKVGTGKFYIAKDFPRFEELNKAMDKVAKSMNNPMSSLYPNHADLPGMVVKTEMTVMGKPTTTELVSAKEGPLSADEFKGPEGYKEMKMPNIPGLFGPKAK